MHPVWIDREEQVRLRNGRSYRREFKTLLRSVPLTIPVAYINKENDTIRTMTFHLDSHMTVLTLRRCVAATLGIPVDIFVLVSDHRLLRDHHRLATLENIDDSDDSDDSDDTRDSTHITKRCYMV